MSSPHRIAVNSIRRAWTSAGMAASTTGLTYERGLAAEAMMGWEGGGSSPQRTGGGKSHQDSGGGHVQFGEAQKVETEGISTKCYCSVLELTHFYCRFICTYKAGTRAWYVTFLGQKRQCRANIHQKLHTCRLIFKLDKVYSW